MVTNAGTGTFTYTPGSDYFGADSLTFKVTDSVGSSSNIAAMNITVTAVNDPPSLSGTPATSAAINVSYSFTPT